MLGTGERAPAFELEDLHGAPHSAAGERSKPSLLVFFKVSCPTCQYTMPFVERLAAAGANPDAPEIIAISQDDAANTIQFQQRFGLSISTLVDPGPRYTASNLYRITHVPSFFLVEPNGTVSLSFDGFEKKPLEQVAGRFGAALFDEGDRVPASRPG